MKSVLVDINIIVDVLLDRKPFIRAASGLWALVETGKVRGMLSAHAVTTIYYLAQKEMGNVRTRNIISGLLRVFTVATVDGLVMQEAMRLPLADFEDAVTAAAARNAGCDYIVTRDPKGFRGSPVPPLTPEAALPLLHA